MGSLTAQVLWPLAIIVTVAATMVGVGVSMGREERRLPARPCVPWGS
jgi:hypothetical protein